MSEQLWGGESGREIFSKLIGKHGESMIDKYLKNQGDEYHKMHSNYQLALF